MADEQNFNPGTNPQTPTNDTSYNNFDPNQTTSFEPDFGQVNNYGTSETPQFTPVEPLNAEYVSPDMTAPDPYASYNTQNQFDPSTDPSGFNPNQQFDPTQAQAYDTQYDQTNQQFDPNAGYGVAGYGATDMNNQDSLNQVNTFEEKKTGNNKLFLILAGVLIVALLGIAGFLVFANRNKVDEAVKPEPTAVVEDKPAEEVPATETEEDTEEDVVDVSLTGGEGTFATLSRKHSSTKIQPDWYLRRFSVPAINIKTGDCLNVALCGPNADPDKDGLKNIDEYNFDADPLLNDTDKDGLADGDELFIYYTDPKTDDSDVDTFADGQEVSGCYDPTKNGKGVKFGTKELGLLKRNTSVIGLYKPTTDTLTSAGAESGDLTEVGTASKKCDVDASKVQPAGADETASVESTTDSDSNASNEEETTTSTKNSTTTSKKSSTTTDEESDEITSSTSDVTNDETIPN